MARGKFNKRGGGKRVDAQSAAEIEQRNERLAAFEEERARRRAEEAEDDNDEEEEGDGEEDEEGKADQGGKKKEKAPVRVTTDAEHKRNLAKLEAVRKRREQAEERRKAEEEAAAMEEAERKMMAAQLQGDSDSDSDDDKKKKKKKSKSKAIPKLTKIEIKKMKPALLKEALKERGLDIQGNAKTLTARLLQYEESR